MPPAPHAAMAMAAEASVIAAAARRRVNLAMGSPRSLVLQVSGRPGGVTGQPGNTRAPGGRNVLDAPSRSAVRTPTAGKGEPAGPEQQEHHGEDSLAQERLAGGGAGSPWNRRLCRASRLARLAWLARLVWIA